MARKPVSLPKKFKPVYVERSPEEQRIAELDREFARLGRRRLAIIGFLSTAVVAIYPVMLIGSRLSGTDRPGAIDGAIVIGIYMGAAMLVGAGLGAYLLVINLRRKRIAAEMFKLEFAVNTGAAGKTP